MPRKRPQITVTVEFEASQPTPEAAAAWSKLWAELLRPEEPRRDE